MTITDLAQLPRFIDAGYSGLWAVTQEPFEAAQQIRSSGNDEWNVYEWDSAQGIHGGNPNTRDPLALLACQFSNNKPVVVVMHNLHRFLQNPILAQALANRVQEGKSQNIHYVVLSPTAQMPLELEKQFAVLTHELPGPEELRAIAWETLPINLRDGTAEEAAASAGHAARGLTRQEAENAFALSLAEYGRLEPKLVWELKATSLKATGAVELNRGGQTLDSLCGLEALKAFTLASLRPASPTGPRPKGVMLLGPPGTGKTAYCKALGASVGRPTLVLDIGALYGSLVGQTEERVRRALAVADAMAPCVLMVDEVEKALAGHGSEGDSGVASRLFGTLLSWLSEHDSDVYTVFTSNDVTRLPPEFTRAERLDANFFLDLPGLEERIEIWRQYACKYQINDKSQELFDATDWTGAEIKSCCRLAALLGVTLAEAARQVIPIAVSSEEKVEALRAWAEGRALDASEPGVYRQQRWFQRHNGPRRNVKARA